MKTVCIVQARLGSTRLPGKVLLPLNGHTIIGEVLTRCWEIPKVDWVICAIPEGDHLLANEAAKYADVVHGPERDVLARYYKAAAQSNADIIIRVTGDCPLISPELCGAVLQKLIDEKADYASNIEPRTFPKGMDCEVFTFAALKRAHEQSVEREHVTTWMRSAAIKRVHVVSPWNIEGRLTLDTWDDYRTICVAFEPDRRLRAA